MNAEEEIRDETKNKLRGRTRKRTETPRSRAEGVARVLPYQEDLLVVAIEMKEDIYTDTGLLIIVEKKMGSCINTNPSAQHTIQKKSGSDQGDIKITDPVDITYRPIK